MMKQGDIFRVKIDNLNGEGEGVARIGEEGLVLFVPGALAGEEAEVRLVTKKKNYGVAKVVKRFCDSPHRVKPRCASFGRCGGCALQHLSYEVQLSLKKKTLADALTRIGGEREPRVFDCEPSPSEWGYRNKASLPVQSAAGECLRAGFYKPRSHDIVPYRGCDIVAPEIDAKTKEILSALRGTRLCGVRLNGKSAERETIREIVVRRACFTGETLLAVICRRAPSSAELKLLRGALREIEGLSGAVCNINGSPGNFIWGEKSVPLFGKETMRERLGKFVFTFEASSFFQVNSEQAAKLYEYAASLALEDSPREILELYAGVGGMTAFLAAGGAKITAVESWEPAAKYIARNAEANGIKKITPLAARVEEAASELSKKNYGTVVLDPPRAGCDEKVVAALLKIAAERIVYVSCNPATLARDIKRLAEGGYELVHAKPFDMFPQTGHVETIVLLQRETL